MKTLARKTNPAFKIAQPLPLWPVGLGGRDDREAARATKLIPSPEAAPRVVIDLALCAMPERREFCTGPCR